ncbi:MAG: cytochrome-c peroxidase [Flavobacteriales bacterium]|jgi:cytochrome c peroxidase
MKWWSLLACVLLFEACSEPAAILPDDQPLEVKKPPIFPVFDYPDDNRPTTLRVLLGRKLFYDTRLSANGTTHCGSCHVLSAAFTDGRATSPGMTGAVGTRNAPTLANIAWMKRLMMEGGVPTLETQALAPLHDSLEMGHNMMHVVERLNRAGDLNSLAKKAYGRDSIDPYVITRALACFQRTFVSGDSRYDRFNLGQKDQMNASELRGKELFFSERTQCASCHSGVFFTDMDYHNIGLTQHYADDGKARATHLPEDIGKFKTPTLRNIQLTSPYMHDGSLSSLEEVIAFYNRGGEAHENRDARIHPLNLSQEESADLLAFLTSLTDWNFVQNKDLLPLEGR